MNDNIEKIVNILIKKNANRETIWTKTSGENEYKIQLNNATLTIDMWGGIEGEEHYDITIYNGRGEQIDYFNISESEYSKAYEFELLKKLYESTVDVYFRKGETINDILSQLNEEGIVGNHNKK